MKVLFITTFIKELFYNIINIKYCTDGTVSPISIWFFLKKRKKCHLFFSQHLKTKFAFATIDYMDRSIL